MFLIISPASREHMHHSDIPYLDAEALRVREGTRRESQQHRERKHIDYDRYGERFFAHRKVDLRRTALRVIPRGEQG